MATFVPTSSFALSSHTFQLIEGRRFKICPSAIGGTAIEYDLSVAAIGLSIEDGDLLIGETTFDAGNLVVQFLLGRPFWSFAIDTNTRAGIGIDDLRDAGMQDDSSVIRKYIWHLEEMPVRLSLVNGFFEVRTEGSLPDLPGKVGNYFEYKMLSETPVGAK